MVTYLNKWLFAALLPFVYTNSLPLPGKQAEPHPLHVTVAEINHNAVDKTLEISCKLFTDDFENILAKTYHVKVDLINPPDRPAMEKLVNDYIHKHLALKADGKVLAFSFIGFEKDNDAIYAYFQADNIPMVKKIDVKDDMLHEVYTDQITLLHIIVGGQRKSTKLDYPATEASVSF